MATKGIPSVPDVPTTLTERDIYRILEPLKRIIDIRQGQFDPLDRWVTQQDLIDAGLQTQGAVEAPVVVVPPTSEYDFQLTGDINGGPTAMATGSALIQMDTLINLPNVTEIDGGDAAETFPGSTQGPYGVAGGGGGGSAIEVEDNGSSLTTGVTKFNFVGFTVTEPVADEITVSSGVGAGNDIYTPGYTSYTRVDNDTFTVDLIRATNLFYPGRRVRFEQTGTFTYGTVTSRDYNTSNANDTTVNLDMEGADTVPTGTFDVSLVSSATAWSPIATDPFSGTKINDIATGAIGGTQWWVAVGDSGKLYTSTDGGITWTSRTSGTTGNINAVIYNEDDEEFYAGGEASAAGGAYLYKTTNGSTWTAVTIPWIDAAGDYIIAMSYGTGQNIQFLALYEAGNSRIETRITDDDWGTYATRAVSTTTMVIAACEHVSHSDTGVNYAVPNATYFYSSFSDTSASFDESTTTTPTALEKIYLTGATTPSTRVFWGNLSGDIGIHLQGGVQILDDVTFSQAIRGFAHSAVHGRTVCVGDSGTIGYIDDDDTTTVDNWTGVSNGFNPLANILAVEFNEVDGVFVAVADNGQICRSSNGTN